MVSCSRSSARSAPALKACSPAPRSTITLTLRSAPASLSAASSPSRVSRSSALRLSARSMVRRRTPRSESSERMRATGLAPVRVESREGVLQGSDARTVLDPALGSAFFVRSPSGGRLLGPVLLGFDLFLHLELKARIVGRIVTGAADLKDHARIALVAERHDRTHLGGVRLHMVASGAVARLAPDAEQAGVGVGLLAGRKAPGPTESRGVALE